MKCSEIVYDIHVCSIIFEELTGQTLTTANNINCGILDCINQINNEWYMILQSYWIR